MKKVNVEMGNIWTMHAWSKSEDSESEWEVYWITGVKQPQDQSNSKVDPYILSFSVAEILGKLGNFAKFY